MNEILKNRFQNNNYIPKTGSLGEEKLLAVNHICIQGDCVLFEDLILPYGEMQIEEWGSDVIPEIIQELVTRLQRVDNREKYITICGNDKARRMLGRKLEDRLKREVEY